MRRIAPPAAVVAGILPILNDAVVFPALVPIADQNPTLIPWLLALDSLMVALFSLAIAVVAMELSRWSNPIPLAAAFQALGIAGGGLKGLMYLLIAATVHSLPRELAPLEALLTIGIGLWILLTAATWRPGRSVPSILFAGLGILVGAVLVVDRALAMDLSPFMTNVGYPLWFVWLAVRMWRVKEVA